MSTRASRLRIRLVVLIVLVVAVVVAIVAVRAWTSGRDAELRRGDTGPRVTALQYLLTAQKFDVPITGTFGSQTQSALQAYEQANGLSGGRRRHQGGACPDRGVDAARVTPVGRSRRCRPC